MSNVWSEQSHCLLSNNVCSRIPILWKCIFPFFVLLDLPLKFGEISSFWGTVLGQKLVEVFHRIHFYLNTCINICWFVLAKCTNAKLALSYWTTTFSSSYFMQNVGVVLFSSKLKNSNTCLAQLLSDSTDPTDPFSYKQTSPVKTSYLRSWLLVQEFPNVDCSCTNIYWIVEITSTFPLWKPGCIK